MLNENRVAVVIPAFNEERLVSRVIAGIPPWVDSIVVVDDASTDGSSRAAEMTRDRRVVVVRHPENRGVGAAIVSGYRSAVDMGASVVAVMAGDNQMDPADLASVVAPVVRGAADYVKGNRFRHPERRSMPLGRRLAGKVLAALTRATTGLVIDDSQCGYTAISARALRGLPLHDLWPRYGYPNDLLGLLSAANFSVAEVPVRPVYADEGSGVRAWHAAVVGAIVVRRWWKTRRSRYDSIARSIISSAHRSA
jgi:glycosyltransferase involved in cell wall biosynthesis